MPKTNSFTLISMKYKRYEGTCDICGLTFHKLLDHTVHNEGKRHLDQLRRTASDEELWKEFSDGATHWAKDCTINDIKQLWTNNELSTLGLKYRLNCLHPSPTIKKLSPYQRARIWRYVRDAMGLSYYPEVARVIAAIDNIDDGHLRVKELFESFEAFRKISFFIINARKTLKQHQIEEPIRIVELAAGHGLVGVLLAYRFNNMQVHLFDLYKRPTFEAYLQAFEEKGLKRPGQNKVLPNIIFHEEDNSNAVKWIDNSIVISIHGCGKLNQDAIEMASKYNAKGWAVIPCCISKDMYLDGNCAVQLQDDTMRHTLLCGALAQEYRAQLVDNIDSRITNKAIFIAGGVNTASADCSAPYDPSLQYKEELRKAAIRGNLPKLVQS